MIIKKFKHKKKLRIKLFIKLMAYKNFFMGTPEFCCSNIKINFSNHKILEVYTQPPKKK